MSKYPIFKEEFLKIKDKYLLHLGKLESLFIIKNGDIPILDINHDLAYFFSLCNGQNSIDDLANLLNIEYGSVTKDDVKGLINQYDDYLELIDKEVNVSNITGSFDIQSPSTISLFLTDKCNFKCQHCYSESGTHNHTFINTEIIDIVSELSELGMRNVEINGGEPFLHPSFNKIMGTVCRVSDHVKILTNGSVISDEHIELLSKFRDKIEFQVSLHGTSNFVNSFVNVDNGFNYIISGIKKLVDNDFTVDISMCVSKDNVNEIVDTAKVAHSLGCKSFNLSSTMELGRATSNYLDFKTDEIQKSLNIINTLFPCFLGEDKIYMINGEEINHCGAFVNKMAIFANGNISICGLDIGLFNHPNVFIDGLDKCLDYMLNFGLDKIEFPSEDLCGNCEHFYFCNSCYIRGLIKYKDIGKCNWGSTWISCKNV
ncbi:MAG: radical SAM protein [Methanobrevibacter sp.]|nr:radical SAM protein [Methanobrevibacter sp.]